MNLGYRFSIDQVSIRENGAYDERETDIYISISFKNCNGRTNLKKKKKRLGGELLYRNS